MVGLTINSARGTQENVVFSESLKWLCANFNVIIQDLDKLAIRPCTYYNLFRSVLSNLGISDASVFHSCHNEMKQQKIRNNLFGFRIEMVKSIL